MAHDQSKCNHREVKLIMDISMSPDKNASCLACGVEIKIIKPNLLIHNFLVKGQNSYAKCGSEECRVCEEKYIPIKDDELCKNDCKHCIEIGINEHCKCDCAEKSKKVILELQEMELKQCVKK